MSATAEVKKAPVIAGAVVKDIKFPGTGKVAVMTVEKAGKELTVKAWADNPFVAANPVGTKIEAAETEIKPNEKYGDEVWVKSPAKSGNRGGGVARSDPAKNAVIEKANANNNATMNYASNLKAAVTCMELSVATLGPGQDVNAYRDRANDFMTAVVEIAKIAGAK